METPKKSYTYGAPKNPDTVSKLTFKENRWIFTSVPAPESVPDGIPILIESVVVPSGIFEAGFWVGRDANSNTARYAGWGPFVDRLAYQTTNLLPLDRETTLSAILSIIACSIIQALQSLEQVSHVGIVGEGLLSAIIEKYLGNRVDLCQPAQDASLDLLIDTSGEPARWNNTLPTLRNEGTLLLFVPPWSQPIAYNFYPQLHRRSMRLVAMRWHLPQPALNTSLRTIANPIVSAIEREGQWIRPLILESSAPEAGVWHWLDWK